MANKPSNEKLLQQLKNGTAKFELLSSPILITNKFSFLSLSNNSHRFFARIGPFGGGGGGSPALKKVEHYSVQRVTGDGRCMFRAMVKGMAMNKGISLSSREERDDAAIKAATHVEDAITEKYKEFYKLRHFFSDNNGAR